MQALTSRGGAIALAGSMTVTMAAVNVTDNNAVSGAGLHASGAVDISLARCDLSRNVAVWAPGSAISGEGGAIRLQGAALKASLTQCRLHGNVAKLGAGIAAGYGVGSISDAPTLALATSASPDAAFAYGMLVERDCGSASGASMTCLVGASSSSSPDDMQQASAGCGE